MTGAVIALDRGDAAAGLRIRADTLPAKVQVEVAATVVDIAGSVC